MSRHTICTSFAQLYMSMSAHYCVADASAEKYRCGLLHEPVVRVRAYIIVCIGPARLLVGSATNRACYYSMLVMALFYEASARGGCLA
eukprot:19901-Heterococcus_DN1.PRE.8